MTPAGQNQPTSELHPVFKLPLASVLNSLVDKEKLLADADRICGGEIPIFGNTWVPLDMSHPQLLTHWSAYSGDRFHGKDIKFTWEPARFCWASTLARAYHISGYAQYAEAFWQAFEAFRKHNPANLGLQWMSAQEVALRMMNWVYAWQVLQSASATTPEREDAFSVAIAEHASRIPPTLMYARAQNNNHLLTEAAGLFTASCIIPDHPDAAEWRDLGWQTLNQGLQEQIEDDGTYVQQSTNYHRLMLQTALWAQMLQEFTGHSFPAETLKKLRASTEWMLGLLDSESGWVPNLGPNDGAYILPTTTQPFSDYRPVLQAAACAFLGGRVFEPGPCDEMALWFQPDCPQQKADCPLHPNRVESANSWAYLRSTKFYARPGHADQNHVDLWRNGENLTLDAGTYHYNSLPPWNNSLVRTDVHNTVSVDLTDQMNKAGKFLWLDWAQGSITDEHLLEDGRRNHIVARHNGYRQFGILHERALSCDGSDYWVVTDNLLDDSCQVQQEHFFRLHWLLPDYPWEWDGDVLQLQAPSGPFRLRISAAGMEANQLQFRIVRAGKNLFGIGPCLQHWGWYSPTYGVKMPALSVSASIRAEIPLTLVSEFTLAGVE